jgi:hypothetical protein
MLPPIAFDLIGLIALAALVWLVWDSLRAREAAVAASRSACSARQWQFLDDTVAIESVRPARDRYGTLRLRRIYGFEYSDTGNSRRKGTVVMLGAEVVLVHIGAHSTLFEPGSEAHD